MVMLMIHPHLPGTLVASSSLYRYVCVQCDTLQRTTAWHALARYSTYTQCTCTTPGTPKVGRSQVIEVTHPLELFRPPAHLQLFLNLSNRRQQPGRIVPPEPRLFPTPTDPTPESNCCAFSPALARNRKRHYRGPAEQIRNQGLSCPNPFLRRSTLASTTPFHHPFDSSALLRHPDRIIRESSNARHVSQGSHSP